METPICNWPGKSGTTYTFNVFDMTTTEWNANPGLYIFAKPLTSVSWKAMYVGETGSYKTRMTTSHEEWSRAVNLGATHVHAMVHRGGKQSRLSLEDDLILHLKSPLNQKVSFGSIPSLVR